VIQNVTSGAILSRAEYGYSNDFYSSANQQSGREATATAVIDTTAIGDHRIGCDMAGNLSMLYCTVSWLCN
jgi:hypothetical protein